MTSVPLVGIHHHKGLPGEAHRLDVCKRLKDASLDVVKHLGDNGTVEL